MGCWQRRRARAAGPWRGSCSCSAKPKATSVLRRRFSGPRSWTLGHAQVMNKADFDCGFVRTEEKSSLEHDPE
jgi:hypothetical protein